MKRIYFFLSLILFIQNELYPQTLNFPVDTIARDDFYNYRSMIKHDANGKLHIANSRQLGTNSNTREVFYRTNIPGHFDTTQLSDNAIDDNYATFDFDGSGNVHVGWERRDGNNNFQVIYSNNITDTFATPVWITAGGLNKATPSIAVGKDSLAHFVYLTFVTGQDSAFYRSYNFITNTLGAVINLGAMEASSENDIEVAVDSNNHVHIVFATNGALSTSALKYFNNENGTLVEISTGLTSNVEYPDMMIDKHNTLHIIYRSAADKRIYTLSKSSGGNLSSPEPVTPANIGFPSYWRAFDVDDEGQLYVTYQNSQSSAAKGIFLVHGKNGNYSAPILVFEDSSGQYITRGSSSVAARGNGDIAVLFDVAGSRSGQVFSDIFLKRGTLVFTDVDEEENVLPDIFITLENYPNPFNPTTTIRYTVNEPQFTTLKVYDILGNEIATLVNQFQQRGVYSVKWDATRYAGTSGLYFSHLKVGQKTTTTKMLLTR
ncbi:MAG: T9SS type A sorting domain-containing protein [Ignavibacteriales bacterium]|nr:T9SS type A sorting domain-containing protein [Ignavibacteriales bacterium]